MTRILLTGGSGFIGSRFLSHLAAANIDVVSIGRGARSNSCATTTDHRVVSRLTADEVKQAVGETPIDAVVHLAAAGVNPWDRDVGNLRMINGLLPSELVELAHAWGARGFIMSGSNSEYARFDGDRIEESAPLEATKLYGATKAAGGLMALATGTALGLPSANLRLFNVYGPGEAPHRLLPSLSKALLRGEDAPLSQGQQVRDFIHVDDACSALMASLSGVMNGTLPTGHYNVCTGEGTSVRNFALAVADALNAAPSLLRFGMIPMRPDDQARVVGDPSAFKSHTGWRPRLSLAEGIAETLSAPHRAEHAGPP
ncbi:NAD(P)-dependent oxidoreductase [Luteibacter jiangsuensis]|uniref:NAD(P)-dependent oxidoreductase n=1 Tax=Luteibacter jiangsuensis TaxID=637577 RepID=A0ABX0Q358_9GAMM|nr:NAD(P)-dependent oxidoreductase [Luteibacter jiangsuensis]NID04172.1 NAD(P)-dependent oxidoreductase [Luteibacter jiangsuensis]